MVPNVPGAAPDHFSPSLGTAGAGGAARDGASGRRGAGGDGIRRPGRPQGGAPPGLHNPAGSATFSLDALRREAGAALAQGHTRLRVDPRILLALVGELERRRAGDRPVVVDLRPRGPVPVDEIEALGRRWAAEQAPLFADAADAGEPRETAYVNEFGAEADAPVMREPQWCSRCHDVYDAADGACSCCADAPADDTAPPTSTSGRQQRCGRCNAPAGIDEPCPSGCDDEWFAEERAAAADGVGAAAGASSVLAAEHGDHVAAVVRGIEGGGR